MSLPRDRNGDGFANDAQFPAAARWSARYRRQHRHETANDRWARWHIAEDQNEEDRNRYR